MINALNVMERSLREAGHSTLAICIDSNISRNCTANRKTSWFKDFSSTDFFSSIKDYFFWPGRQISGWALHEGALPKILGRKKSTSIVRYFRSQSLQIFWEIRALSSLLYKKQPKVVILSSDAHRVGRIITSLSSQFGIRTVVYQHGATIWKYGYVPVYADRMLVWGKVARQWFEERGVPTEKLIEIGNLLVDKMAHMALAPMVNKKRKIFFFPNPIDRNITEQALVVFCHLCIKNGLHGVLKLHPSERNLGFFISRTAHIGTSVSITCCPTDQADIRFGDIAIVVNSTAGLECVLLGALILNIAFEGIPNPINYQTGGVGIVTALNECDEAFQKLISISTSRYLACRSLFIEDHLGSLDGMASSRALHAIEELANNSSAAGRSDMEHIYR